MLFNVHTKAANISTSQTKGTVQCIDSSGKQPIIKTNLFDYVMVPCCLQFVLFTAILCFCCGPAVGLMQITTTVLAGTRYSSAVHYKFDVKNFFAVFFTKEISPFA